MPCRCPCMPLLCPTLHFPVLPLSRPSPALLPCLYPVSPLLMPCPCPDPDSVLPYHALPCSTLPFPCPALSLPCPAIARTYPASTLSRFCPALPRACQRSSLAPALPALPALSLPCPSLAFRCPYPAPILSDLPRSFMSMSCPKSALPPSTAHCSVILAGTKLTSSAPSGCVVQP